MSGKSLTYKIKRNGPRMDPRGTPDVDAEEVSVLNSTYAVTNVVPDKNCA